MFELGIHDQEQSALFSKACTLQFVMFQLKPVKDPHLAENYWSISVANYKMCENNNYLLGKKLKLLILHFEHT